MDNCGSNPYKSILKTLLITAIGARSLALKILKASTETQPRNLWVLHTPLQPSVECYPSSSMQLALGESPPVGSLGAGCMDGQYTLIFQVPFIGFGSTPRAPGWLVTHQDFDTFLGSGFPYIYDLNFESWDFIFYLLLNGSEMSICVYGPTAYMILKGAILLYNTYWPVQCRLQWNHCILIGLDPSHPTPPKKKVIHHNAKAKATFTGQQKKSLPPIAPPKAPTYPLLSPPAGTPRPHRRRPPGGLRGYKHLRVPGFFFWKAKKWG